MFCHYYFFIKHSFNAFNYIYIRYTPKYYNIAVAATILYIMWHTYVLYIYNITYICKYLTLCRVTYTHDNDSNNNNNNTDMLVTIWFNIISTESWNTYFVGCNNNIIIYANNDHAACYNRCKRVSLRNVIVIILCNYYIHLFALFVRIPILLFNVKRTRMGTRIPRRDDKKICKSINPKLARVHLL